jgi:hypothetical protein
VSFHVFGENRGSEDANFRSRIRMRGEGLAQNVIFELDGRAVQGLSSA